MNRSVIILISTLVLGCVYEANGKEEEFLISNESFLNLGDGEIDQHLVGRAVTSAGLSDSEIASFLDKHNELRGQTVPTASNMQYMVWDYSLAAMAQQWSDRCEFAHGNPTNISPFSSIGQNLYMVGPSSKSSPVKGANAVQSWFNEDQYYTYENGSCTPKKVCGHYTQVVWARSYAVGCGASFCPLTIGKTVWKDAWLVTCNYGPAGNGAGKPFLQGTPCTQCDSGIGQCYKDQCRLCSTHSEKCECKQVCFNGAVFDQAKCSCKCADGFHGTDCSQVCEDTHSNCGAGWPKSWCDEEHSYVLTNCPAMCGLCTRAPCFRTCNAKGGTLDTERCICKCNEGFQGEDCGTCVKECKNGGQLNPQDCECKCPAGFGGVECEKVCEDTHSNCGASPGWPKSWCDEEHSYVLTNCPAMCGLCTRAPCLRTCNAKGGTLDTERCICKCNEGFQGEDCGTCVKECKNGGQLNPQDCECKCPAGFGGVECEKVCEDTHKHCGASPGWPKSWCDAAHSYVLTYCPAFCGLCTRAPCLRTCNAKGGTLDTERCICKCNAGFQGEDCGTCVKDCKNGGELKQPDCECKCQPGFAGVECEKVCEDTHHSCGASPGWPKSWCDAEHSYVLTNCPAFCGLCEPAAARGMQLTDENIKDELQ